MLHPEVIDLKWKKKNPTPTQGDPEALKTIQVTARALWLPTGSRCKDPTTEDTFLVVIHKEIKREIN